MRQNGPSPARTEEQRPATVARMSAQNNPGIMNESCVSELTVESAPGWSGVVGGWGWGGMVAEWSGGQEGGGGGGGANSDSFCGCYSLRR